MSTWAAQSISGRYQRITGRCLTASAPRLVSSVYRLATDTPSAPRLHTSRNQTDGLMWVAAAPPSSRSTNPDATISISTNGTCLSLNEERNDRDRYEDAVTTSSGSRITTPMPTANAAASTAST